MHAQNLLRKPYNFEHIQDLKLKGYTFEAIAKIYGRERSVLNKWFNKQLTKQLIPTESKKDRIASGTDTRDMLWYDWAKKYLNKKLLNFQIEVLDAIEKTPTIITIARQSGKSSFILLTYIIRKLCESIYDNIDRPILYISNSSSNIRSIFTSVRAELMLNETIISTYGMLVDRERVDGIQISPQNQREIRLVTLKDSTLISFYATTPLSGIRGKNFFLTIIDDPVDFKEIRDVPSKAIKITNDIIDWLFKKVLPLTKGNLIVCGTRYAKHDLFYQLEQQGMYTSKNYPAIIGQMPTYKVLQARPLTPKHIIVDQGNYKLLAPEIWKKQKYSKFLVGTPIQNILFKCVMMGDENFQQEYMNNPYERNAVIDYGHIQEYTHLPIDAAEMKWVIFVDPASGKTAASDVTSIVLLGFYMHKFHIHDIIFGHWSGREKQTQLEAFEKKYINNLKLNSIMILLEVVRNQDFYNRLIHESSVVPKAVNPKNRGEKNERILHNLGTEVENGTVSINRYCRSKKQLQFEIEGFPTIHPDIIDALDQAVNYLKLKNRKSHIRGF